MRLTSPDGASVELRPVSYEFGATPHAQPGTDSDANWLVVHGRIRTSDGRCWEFTDPCLTTWEAAQVSAWLRRVAAGLVPPVPGEPAEGDLLHFTEPNVAFSLHSRSGDTARVRVHLSMEAGPPWRDAQAPHLYEAHCVSLELTRADLVAAAEVWDGERKGFPVR